MPSLTIIRGLPGSGKSTLAHDMAAKTGKMVLEPDALLMSAGTYYYDKQSFKKACQACRFLLGICAKMDADCIYADVLPTKKDVDELVAFYRSWIPGDRPFILFVHTLLITPEQSHERNRHLVRVEDINEMALHWEPYPDETIHRVNEP